MVQLLLGLAVMMAISSPQYVWTLFVKPFQAATGAGLPRVQITFSVLIVLQTLFSPAQGLAHRPVRAEGVRCPGGAALTGLGWVLSARVDTAWMLFLTYGRLDDLDLDPASRKETRQPKSVAPSFMGPDRPSDLPAHRCALAL